MRRFFARLFFGLFVFFCLLAAGTFNFAWAVPAIIAIFFSILLFSGVQSTGKYLGPAPEPVSHHRKTAIADADIFMYDNESGEVFTQMTPEQRRNVQKGMRFE